MTTIRCRICKKKKRLYAKNMCAKCYDKEYKRRYKTKSRLVIKIE